MRQVLVIVSENNVQQDSLRHSSYLYCVNGDSDSPGQARSSWWPVYMKALEALATVPTDTCQLLAAWSGHKGIVWASGSAAMAGSSSFLSWCHCFCAFHRMSALSCTHHGDLNFCLSVMLFDNFRFLLLFCGSVYRFFPWGVQALLYTRWGRMYQSREWRGGGGLAEDSQLSQMVFNKTACVLYSSWKGTI
jgi:hypothetical protein